MIVSYKQTVLVGGVVHNNGKILLLRRLDTKRFFPGHWEIPGGKLDPGESPQQAIVREMKEETGLDGVVKGRIGEAPQGRLPDGRAGVGPKDAVQQGLVAEAGGGLPPDLR